MFVRAWDREGGWVIQRHQDVTDQLYLVEGCWWVRGGGWVVQ